MGSAHFLHPTLVTEPFFISYFDIQKTPNSLSEFRGSHQDLTIKLFKIYKFSSIFYQYYPIKKKRLYKNVHYTSIAKNNKIGFTID